MPKTRRTSDTTLVRRSQQGDRRAFSALLGRYDWRLRGLAHALLLDRAEMDAALATGYLRAWRDVVRVNPKEDVAAWLYRVTYNACIDQLRLAEGNTRATDPAAGHSGVAAGLAGLPAAERVAVVLVDREGFSPASAARILGMPGSVLTATLESARERLIPHIPEPAPDPVPALEASTGAGSSAAPEDNAADPVATDGAGDAPSAVDSGDAADGASAAGEAPAASAIPDDPARAAGVRPTAPAGAGVASPGNGSRPGAGAPVVPPGDTADVDLAASTPANGTKEPAGGTAAPGGGGDVDLSAATPGNGTKDPDGDVAAPGSGADVGGPTATPGNGHDDGQRGDPRTAVPAGGAGDRPLHTGNGPHAVGAEDRGTGAGSSGPPHGDQAGNGHGSNGHDVGEEPGRAAAGAGAPAGTATGATAGATAGDGSGAPVGVGGAGDRNRGKGRRARRRAKHVAGQHPTDGPGPGGGASL